MIASVRGEVIARGEDWVVVETGGVGLRLTVPSETLRAVPAIGQEVSLLSEMVVRDDAISLYGFASEEERDLFGMLTTVNGVGPRVAISALSTATPRQLARAVDEGDSATFVGIPGIGRRTAERIVVELRGKVAEAVSPEPPGPASAGDQARELARAGLMGLGYDSAEADSLLSRAGEGTAQELIAAALREAAGGPPGR